MRGSASKGCLRTLPANMKMTMADAIRRSGCAAQRSHDGAPAQSSCAMSGEIGHTGAPRDRGHDRALNQMSCDRTRCGSLAAVCQGSVFESAEAVLNLQVSHLCGVGQHEVATCTVAMDT